MIFGLMLLVSTAYSQELEFPIIKNYGGVVVVPNTIKPTQGGKIIIDISSAEETGEGVNKSLDRVARLINLYGLANIQPADLELVVIVHGGATKTVLSHDGFKDKYHSGNPDLDLIDELTKYGVKVLVCSQALVRRGYKTEWLNPNVGLALSAITTLVEYDQKGFVTLIY